MSPAHEEAPPWGEGDASRISRREFSDQISPRSRPSQHLLTSSQRRLLRFLNLPLSLEDDPKLIAQWLLTGGRSRRHINNYVNTLGHLPPWSERLLMQTTRRRQHRGK